jgi:eukaryotic-like serine/threonine-protein kinase
MISQKTSENYEKVKEIFSAALELSTAERDEFLAAQDKELRREVESLLLANEEAGNFLNEASAVEVVQNSIGKSDNLAGQKIDKYRIEREIGRGGMGVVYLATREDFQQQVALKLIKRGMDSDAIIERFAREREFLASLNHPNIARLLDGGTTDEGTPYFVMEYVEGTPVDEYCKTEKPSEKEKLELFLKICAAVAFAHQKLIVHRDLKPSNILVDKTGDPKLLDFGIAKLLNSTDRETQTNQRVLTPAYASPEQIRGEMVGTTSDVFSLGVILKELLTKEKVVSAAVAERLKSSVNETKSKKRISPNSPFSTPRSPTLKGDLHDIVAQAARQEVSRRYASVEAFSEDIRRYLADLPIAARKDSFAYRASKFVQRNRIAAAAAVLLLLSLIGGIAATIWQARIAQRERALAEQRFESLRKSSRSMVSEIHAAMMNLPGSLEARKLLLQRAVEQLDTLATGAGDNRQLQLDLADAYQNIGYLPDKPLAERTELFNKSIAFYQNILAADPKHIEARKGLAMSKVNLADFARLRGETDEALNYNREAVALLESIVADEPDNLKHKTALWNVSYNAALTLTQTGRAAEALDICRRMRDVAVELREKDSTDTSDNKFRRPYLSLGLASSSLIFLGRYDEAITEIRTALEENAKTRQMYPEGMIERLDESVFNWRLSMALERSGKMQEAIEAMKKSLDVVEQLAKDSPKDSMYQTSAAEFNSLFGHLLVRRAGKEGEAVNYFNRAIELGEKAIAADAQQKQAKADLAYAYGGRGYALAKTGKTVEGINDGRKALAIYEELSTENSSNAASLRNYADALRLTGETLLLLPNEHSKNEGQVLLEKSLAIWLKMRERGILSRFDEQQPAKIQNQIR